MDIYAVWIPPSVVLSSRDKAPGLALSPDHLICYSENHLQTTGFRTVRASHGVLHNFNTNPNKALKAIAPYFWECEVLSSNFSPPESHVRIGDLLFIIISRLSFTNKVQSTGWSTNKSELNAPVGFDKFGFGYRDISGCINISIRILFVTLLSMIHFNQYTCEPIHCIISLGSVVHQSLRRDNYGASFTSGDIIGVYILLDDVFPANNIIKFYKNGVDQGIAFAGKEITPGIYFPTVSLYGSVGVCLSSLKSNLQTLIVYRYIFPAFVHFIVDYALVWIIRYSSHYSSQHFRYIQYDSIANDSWCVITYKYV